MGSTILIHSYLYLNSKYLYSDINLTSDYKYIKDINNNIIYGLCNIPNKNDILYESSIYLDKTKSKNSNSQLLEDQDFDQPKDLNQQVQIFNYNLIIKLDNNKIKNKLLSAKKKYSVSSLIYLIDKYINLFCNKNIDQIENNQNNNILYEPLFEVETINNFEDQIYLKNKFSELIDFDNNNFLDILDIMCRKNLNNQNKILIRGGIIIKSIYSYSNIINVLNSKKKKNLLVTNSQNISSWEFLLNKKEISYYLINNNSNLLKLDPLNKFEYVIIDYNIYNNIYNKKLGDNFNFLTKIKWFRIVYDYNFDFFKSRLINSTDYFFSYKYIWFIIDKYNLNFKSCILDKLSNYLVKSTNLRKEFNDLLRRKIIFDNNQNKSIEKINLFLKFSDQEIKYYNFCLSNKNNLYLRKLCCYPDNFYKLSEIMLKSYTISNYIQIIENYYQNCKYYSGDNNSNKEFSLAEINKFGLKDIKCPICLDDVKKDNFGITICGHIFCYSCINSYSNCNLKNELKCPKCRTLMKSNNIFKIDNNNSLFKLSEYNNHYLSNLIGTKLNFILNYCSKIIENKNIKVILYSQYYSFLNKINELFNLFKLKSLFVNDTQSLDYLQTINEFNQTGVQLLLLHSLNYINNFYFEKIDYIIFCEPNFNQPNLEDNIIRKFYVNKITKVKMIKLIIDNTIEKDILMNNII